MQTIILSWVKSPWRLGLIAGLFAVLALRLPVFVIPATGLVVIPILQFGLVRGGMAVLVGACLLLAGWLALGLPLGQMLPLALPVWLAVVPMALFLRRSSRLEPPLLWAGAIMLIFVLGMHTWTDDVVSFWREWLNHAMAAVPGADLKGLEEASMMRLVNGFVAMVFGLALMLSLMLGRWLQYKLFPSGSFAREFRELSLPTWVLALAVAVIWAGGLRDVVMLSDLLMVAMLLYSMVGLAVIHGVLFVRGMSAGWLWPVYLLMAFLPPEALATLALIGAVDAFVHFRIQERAS